MMLHTVSPSGISGNNSLASGGGSMLLGGSESQIVDIVTQLGATFTRLIELMLSKEIKVWCISIVFNIACRQNKAHD